MDEAAADATTDDGLRFAFGTLTVFPVRVTRWDRAAAGRGMAWAPLVGLAVGAAAAVAGTVLTVLGTGPLLAAVASVAVPALLTRGLHLDGLADVADGLGSGRPAPEALRIMKQSDVGPFGVATLTLVLLAQVAALAELYGTAWSAGAAATVASGVSARTALTLASRRGMPAARRDGLGSVVAGTVPSRAVGAAAGAGVVVAAAVCGAADGIAGGLRCAVALALALAAAESLLRRCRSRFGGVTGDVFGAAAECAATVSLVVLAAG
ncbi:adenosylcobinamide-GDP ribazoletransferase [Streptomyces sp. TR06-5]|uniref:adenosylcobinamide-GDP ribazoletransferase n=1 Tax=unclassified Streptomyces TaxID=2593676 RepID=UPI0039A0FC79